MSEKAPVTIPQDSVLTKACYCALTPNIAQTEAYESKVFHIQHYGAHVLMLLVGSGGYAKRAVEMVTAESRIFLPMG